MVRIGPLLLLILAVIIVAVSGLLIWDAMNLSAPQGAPKEVEKIVVAKFDLSWGTTLTDQMLILQSKETVLNQNLVPGEEESSEQFSSIEAVAGRVLAVNLQIQQPILKSHLAPRGIRAGVDAILDPQKRAMAVKVDQEVAVAGFIKPGHHVDVLVTMTSPTKGAGTIAKTVIENVRVLAAGTQMQFQGEDGKAQPVSIMTLEVTPQEAEKLTLASTRGRLRLVLRSSRNPDEVLTQGATAKSLLNSYQLKSKKRSSSKKKHSVEVIKGSTTSKQKF